MSLKHLIIACKIAKYRHTVKQKQYFYCCGEILFRCMNFWNVLLGESLLGNSFENAGRWSFIKGHGTGLDRGDLIVVMIR